MSDSKYTVTEPHPHVKRNSYMGSGRGGAGNIFRAPATTPASGISTPAVTSPPSSAAHFYSGRGGAGNAYSASQRTVMSFEEQYQLQNHIEGKPQGHVGRGGAGNVFGNQHQGRRDSDASSQSSGSQRSGIMERLRHSISRN